MQESGSNSSKWSTGDGDYRKRKKGQGIVKKSVGTQVKIPDIGPLATVIQTGRNMVKIDFLGERFWIEKDLLELPWIGDDEW